MQWNRDMKGLFFLQHLWIFLKEVLLNADLCTSSQLQDLEVFSETVALPLVGERLGETVLYNQAWSQGLDWCL